MVIAGGREWDTMRREFHFREGTSNKFWAIEVQQTQFTVKFGKIGTAGQTQTKSFGSEAEALKQSQKLIAEKTGKGYVEVGSSPSGPQPELAEQAEESPPVSASSSPPSARPLKKAPEASLSATESRQPEIALDAVDWFWKTSPRPAALPLPVSPDFDRANCLKRLRAGVGKLAVCPGMSAQEASFWLSALKPLTEGAHRDEVAEQLADQAMPKWSVSAVSKTLASEHFRVLSEHPALALTASSRALEPEDFLKVAVSLPSRREVLQAIRRFVLPYWSDDEVARLKTWLEPELPRHPWPTDYYQLSPMAWQLAAMLGMHEPLRALVGSWPDKHYGDPSWDHSHYHAPQPIVLGLGDPDLALIEFRRLRLSLGHPDYIRGWLATAGVFAMDFPRDCILAVKGRPDAEPLVEALGLARAPETAPAMLELKMSSKAPKPASQWLEANLEQAAAGLLETANGRGRLSDLAVDFLRQARKKGVELVLPRPLERVQRDVIDWVEPHYVPFDATTTPDWLRTAPTNGKLPAWLDLSILPPLVVGQNCLSGEQLKTVVSTLARATFESPPELLLQLRQQVDEPSRSAFAWSLFESWLGEGAPSKERWAMAATGFLGGDETALKLTPLIRKWPGESQHQRAVFGLECLRAMATDTALMCLNGMAQKLEFKALKAKAMECMEGIARQRKMTRAQLEDRIVPDCGLDARGTRVFDYGGRQFRFALGDGMKPMVRGVDNRLKSELPAPNAKDDAQLAAASIESWKLLKKQLKSLVKVQAERLEQAMVTGRRWTGSEFGTLLLGHPLMINLVRLLLWGTYDEQGRLVSAFRVDEEGQLADSSDERFVLSESASVALVHPLHLSQEQKMAWGTIFADYEILAPFPQLSRACYLLEEGERGQKAITRYQSRKVSAPTLVGTFEKLGWARGVPEDGGVFHEHSKPFYGANITAVAQYEGVPVGSYMADWDDQSVERCFFVPGLYTPESYPSHGAAMPLGEVNPIAVSEVLADLETLAEKAR